MENILFHEQRKRELEKLGTLRASEFDWAGSARETISVIKKHGRIREWNSAIRKASSATMD